jgi:ACS family hexuronate transporter-like MFS transporter
MTEPRPPLKYVRWRIALLLCFAAELNYLDRQTLSVLATQIQQDVGFSDAQYGQITSAFLLSYTVMYAVSGRIIDMIGTRLGFLYFVTAWSIAAMGHGLAGSVFQFQIARFTLGTTEAAIIPGGVKAASEWFPMRERALAVGIFNAGTALGSTLAVPIVGTLGLFFGWQWAFVFTGAMGFLWLPFWYFLYQKPEDHPRISDEERHLILSDRTVGDQLKSPPLSTLLKMPETWGCVAARALTDPITYFLMFWVPKYLQEVRGISLAELAAIGWMPFAALAVGNIASGGIPRFLVGRGLDVNRARKLTMFTISTIALILFVSLTRTESTVLAVACITGAMFCHGAWGNVTLPAEVFPSRAVGTVTGFGGCLGGAIGFVTQLMIGRVVETAGYVPLFLVCSVAYLVAFTAVVLLIGELGRVRQLADHA